MEWLSGTVLCCSSGYHGMSLISLYLASDISFSTFHFKHSMYYNNY